MWEERKKQAEVEGKKLKRKVIYVYEDEDSEDDTEEGKIKKAIRELEKKNDYITSNDIGPIRQSNSIR
jgi:hypothetical protein